MNKIVKSITPIKIKFNELAVGDTFTIAKRTPAVHMKTDECTNTAVNLETGYTYSFYGADEVQLVTVVFTVYEGPLPSEEEEENTDVGDLD